MAWSLPSLESDFLCSTKIKGMIRLTAIISSEKKTANGIQSHCTSLQMLLKSAARDVESHSRSGEKILVGCEACLEKIFLLILLFKMAHLGVLCIFVQRRSRNVSGSGKKTSSY